MDKLQAFTQGAPVSAVLLALMVVLSFLGWSGTQQFMARNLFRPYWFWSQRQLLTPVTSAFIHADVAHLLFNAFTFWAFAFALERALGSMPFLALYGVGVLASDAWTYLRHRRDPAYGTLGASGAILAVLFASIVYFPGQKLFILPIPVPIPAPLFALGYLAYSVFASRLGRGRVNHDAHLGGAVAGVAFVALTDPDALARALGTFWR